MLSLADAYSQSVSRTTAFCQSLTTGKSHDSPTFVCMPQAEQIVTRRRRRLFGFQTGQLQQPSCDSASERRQAVAVGATRRKTLSKSLLPLGWEKVAGGRMRELFAGSDSIKSLTALPNGATRLSIALMEQGCPISNTNLDPAPGQLTQFRDTYSGIELSGLQRFGSEQRERRLSFRAAARTGSRDVISWQELNKYERSQQ